MLDYAKAFFWFCAGLGILSLSLGIGLNIVHVVQALKGCGLGG